MAQKIDDTLDEYTIHEAPGSVLTVAKLRESIAQYPDDARVVFPLVVGDEITDVWLNPAIIGIDDVQNLVGIALYVPED